MKSSNEHLKNHRIIRGPLASNSGFGMTGAFLFTSPIDNVEMVVISDDGIQSQWEHVSVSRKKRCPNWPEMCFIKDLFWDEEEMVIQYHPPKSEYVNMHPNVLHMWRPKKKKIIAPPSILVGLKKED